jgi:hypothetical protein
MSTLCFCLYRSKAAQTIALAIKNIPAYNFIFDFDKQPTTFL